ncbi:S8 family serine peptidase [Promicromonospora sp. CA-289599]|uniref:S8 family serine peptidase n=1 Tax=Promicromonospora sp. CA-289599 TaxID=3240014 RepID=UPI003D93CEC5
MRVAVLDGGIDDSHPALKGTVSQRWVVPGVIPGDAAHGTQVAGVLVGHKTGKFPGGAGTGAQLMDVVVADADGHATAQAIAQGIDWSVEQEADTVVIALALEHDDVELRQAVAVAIEHDVRVVAATGNGIGSFDAYPAAYDRVIGVTGHDGRGSPASLANGRDADIAADGMDVLAPSSGGGYETVSGTSIATGIAAGQIVSCCTPFVPEDDTDLGTRTSVPFPDGPVPVLECLSHNKERNR